ncbi:MAG: hypothetical protein K1X36_11650 [Pyrinomonadaceae bacterium]|nr:hypothetical protein [Pyrinomonadaceae bacterium]
MKKVILGIFVILVIQAGFIWLTSVDRKTENDAMAKPIVSELTPDAIDMIADVGSTGPDNADLLNIGASTIRRHPYSAGSRVAKAGRREVPTVSANAPLPMIAGRLEPVVISVGDTRTAKRSASHPDPAINMTEDRSVRTPNKRSFISRSLSVVKAPYRWIRSLRAKIL